jgi:zinc/manganese transport system substrate-binding protein
MKTNRNIVSLAMMTLAIAALSSAAARPLRIVSTVPELGSIAASIAGDRAEVRSISSGLDDPHFLQPRPSFVLMARDADLWLRIGLELEIGWEPVLLDSSRNPRIRPGQPGHFDAGSFVSYVLDVPHTHATRAQGDVHPSGNPHYMLDPLNGRAVAEALAKRLIDLDPAHRETYEANLARWKRQLDEAMFGAELVKELGGDALWAAEAEGRLDALLEERNLAGKIGGWLRTLRPWKGKPIVTFHKSFDYFAHRFGVVVDSQLEPVPGVPPTPGHLAQVVGRVKAHGITLLLKEPFYPKRPADFMVRQTGIRVVEVSSYARSTEPNAYLKLLADLIAVFKE